MKKLVYAMGALALWNALYYGTYVVFGKASLPVDPLWINLACAVVVLVVFLLSGNKRAWIIEPKVVVGAGVAYTLGMVCLLFGSPWLHIAGFCVASLMRAYFSVVALFIVASFIKQPKVWAPLAFFEGLLVPLVIYFAGAEGGAVFIACLVVITPVCMGVLCACSLDGMATYESLRQDKACLGSKEAVFLIALLVAIHAITRFYHKQTFVFDLAATSLTSAFPVLIASGFILLFILFTRRKQTLPSFTVFAGVLAVVFFLSFPLGFAFGGSNGGVLSEGVISVIGRAQRVALPLVIMFSRFALMKTFALTAFACASFPWYDLANMLYVTDMGRFALGYSGIIVVVLVAVLCVWALFYNYKKQNGLVSQSNIAQVHSLEEYQSLSERESEVFELLLKGYSASKIGEKLFISESTVRFHVTNIYKKFNVKTKQELLDYVGAITVE